MSDYPSKAVDSARVPTRVVLGSMIGLWLCYFVLTTLRGSVVGLELEHELLWRRGVVSLAGIALTVVLWLVLRLFERRKLGVKIAVALIAAMPAAVMIAQVNQWIFAPIEAEVEQRMGQERGIAIRRDEAGNLLVDIPSSQMSEEMDVAAPPRSVVIAPAPTTADRWRMTFDIALGRYFLLLAWASLYLALVAGAQASVAQAREERFRSAAKAAELRSLRYQVNPHFLFNTLNSLSALVLTGKSDKAEQMIQSISRFYRHSLAEDSTGDVSLDDEIDLQEHYLDIESVRFPQRLKVKIDLPGELAGCMVPGMILQPLIENSVKYAISVSKQPVTITISAREEFGRLVLVVSDNGPGKGDTLGGAKPGLGIGLANVRDRLEARFGDAASLATGPVPGGYSTELRLPLVKHG